MTWFSLAVVFRRDAESAFVPNFNEGITAARAKAAQLFTEVSGGNGYRTGAKAPYLCEFAVRFFSFVENARLAEKSKDYLRNGWRLLAATNIPGMRIEPDQNGRCKRPASLRQRV